MKHRYMVAVAAALVLVACGDEESCPREAAAVEPGQPMAGKCVAPAPQQVRITLELCEQCSRTTPSCDPQILGGGEIFLNTSWETCEENQSCSGEACGQVVCSFSVPEGTYTVSTLVPGTTGSTASFDLVVSGASASCSGSI